MFAILTRLRVAAAAILLVLVVLSLVFVVPIIAVADGRTEHHGLVMEMLPMPFYLWAIWTARRAILMIGSDDVLSSVMSRMLSRIGIALVVGGLMRVFGVPLVLHFTSGSRAIGYYASAAFTVGAIGLTLIIVARLVSEAEATRAKLNEFV